MSKVIIDGYEADCFITFFTLHTFETALNIIGSYGIPIKTLCSSLAGVIE